MSEKDKTSHPLYFIALIPPEKIAIAITAVKEEMALQYRSKAALRSPPHITLHMPFRWPEKKMEKLQQTLSEFASTHAPLEIKLKDFGAFPPRVIYVGVEANDQLEQMQGELLVQMRKRLNLLNGDYKKRPFHPHITVAFRDLKPKNFKLAWEIYQNRQLSFHFKATNITLLKHNEKIWEIFQQFHLKGKTT